MALQTFVLGGQRIRVDVPPGASLSDIRRLARDQADRQQAQTKRDITPAAPSQQDESLILQALQHPFTVLGDEFVQGIEMIKASSATPDLTIGGRMLRFTGGTLRAAFSPLTAVTKGVVGDPLALGLKSMGVREDVADNVGDGIAFALDLLIPGGFLKVGARAAIAGGKKAAAVTADMARASAGMADQASVAKGVAIAKSAGSGATKEAAEAVEIALSRTDPLLMAKKVNEGIDELTAATTAADLAKVSSKSAARTSEIVSKTTSAARASATGSKSEKKLLDELTRDLKIGDIEPGAIREVLRANGISPEEFAKHFTTALATGGKILRRSQIQARVLAKTFEKNPRAQLILDEFAAKYETGVSDAFLNGWQRIENLRRAFLVSQLSTAVRNAWTGVGNVSLQAVEMVIQNALVGGAKIARGQFRDGTNELFAGVNAVVRSLGRMAPSGRKELTKILNSEVGARYKARLHSRFASDVLMDTKVAKLTNVFNRMQEKPIRMLAFETKLRELLTRRGQKFGSVAPEAIARQDLDEALNYALRATFAASPKRDGVAELIRAWERIPLLTAAVPFPRFIAANAIPFIFHRSPLGLARLLTPQNVRSLGTLARGRAITPQQVDELSRIASEFGTGQTMLWSAWHLRQSEYAGDKWYELNVGDTTLDMRPFAPFSVYMFLSEAMLSPEKLQTRDYADAFLGIRGVSGTVLAVGDLIKARTGESFLKITQDITGRYLGSFSVPLRQVADIVDGFTTEDAVLRDTRHDPLLGPFVDNLPIIKDKQPVRYTPLKAGPTVRSDRVEFDMFGQDFSIPRPLMRQFFGLSAKTKEPLQKVVDELGVDMQAIFPRTGIPEANNIMAYWQGYFMERLMLPVIQAGRLDNLSPATKKMVVERFFASSKAYARGMLARYHRRLFFEVQEKQLDTDAREFQKELFGQTIYERIDADLEAQGVRRDVIPRGARERFPAR